MAGDREERDPWDRAGVVAADRTVGVFPARVKPVEYGRGTTLVVVLVILLLAFLCFGLPVILALYR